MIARQSYSNTDTKPPVDFRGWDEISFLAGRDIWLGQITYSGSLLDYIYLLVLLRLLDYFVVLGLNWIFSSADHLLPSVSPKAQSRTSNDRWSILL